MLEYRNLTMRPVFTDWLVTSQVSWHLLNEVNHFSVMEPFHLIAGLSTVYILSLCYLAVLIYIASVSALQCNYLKAYVSCNHCSKEYGAVSALTRSGDR